MRCAGCCLGIVLVLATGCADSKPSTPAIWRVSDADNSLYLLGSFHALKPADYPMSKAVEDAYNDAEQLVFEVSSEQLQSTELAGKMLQAAQLSDDTKLQNLLPEALWNSLRSWLDDHPEVPATQLQQVKPWYAALLVVNSSARAMGFHDEQGLDQHFMGKAGKSAKPSRGLEQASQQIALFNNMPLPAQIELLQEALQDPGAADRELDALHGAWKAGDVRLLERLTIDEMRGKYPDMYLAINVQRNQAWLPQLQTMLDDEPEDDALVVVGALHLLGPDGLVQQLQNRGYRVERLK